MTKRRRAEVAKVLSNHPEPFLKSDTTEDARFMLMLHERLVQLEERVQTLQTEYPSGSCCAAGSGISDEVFFRCCCREYQQEAFVYALLSELRDVPNVQVTCCDHQVSSNKHVVEGYLCANAGMTQQRVGRALHEAASRCGGFCNPHPPAWVSGITDCCGNDLLINEIILCQGDSACMYRWSRERSCAETVRLRFDMALASSTNLPPVLLRHPVALCRDTYINSDEKRLQDFVAPVSSVADSPDAD